MRRFWLRCAVLSLALLGCAGNEEQTTAWHQEAGYRWRPLRVAGSSRAGFTGISARQSGISFRNAVSDSNLQRNRILGQGAGVALGDVDGDGLVDVFLARTEGCNALYRNRGGWRFEDITQRAGVGACDRFNTATALADLDGDRDLDLLLLATRGPNAVFLNDGRGTFTERRDLGLDTAGRGGTTIAIADTDRDGWVDVYVANYMAFMIDDSIPPQARQFSEIIRRTGNDTYEVASRFRDLYRIVNRPDMGGRRLTTRAAPDEFYVNRNGRLQQVREADGRFRDSDGGPLRDERESFGLTARFADLNQDGAPDLYVANDFEDIDELWFNDGRGTFRRAPWNAVRQMSNASMGIDVADVNGDALPDVLVVDMLSHDTKRLKTQMPTHTPLPKTPGDVRTILQQQRNTLFLNRGDGTFAEVGAQAGVQASGWSWSAMFLDVDLDGWQDALVTNGHLWDIMDADTHERLQATQPEFHWQRFRWQFPPLPLKNIAFRNRGDLTFEDASDAWRFGLEEDISHTMAAGDLDGDGDLDVVVNRLGADALVQRNDAPAPRIAVRLVGAAPNTQAVGATIRLEGGAVPIQVREVAAGGLYMSHSDYQATFAMGAADSAMLVVAWPDGRRTTIPNVRPNRLYEIDQASAEGAARGGGRANKTASQSAGSPSPSPSPLFEDASAQLGGHRHVDPPFDDWTRQALLPNSLSQLGPGVAWFDYDRDGDEDLFIGAGRSGRIAAFENARGRLSPSSVQLPSATSDFTAVLGHATSQVTTLIAGVSSWESSGGVATPAALAMPIWPRSSSSISLPAQDASTGPIALADYDADGDLDLFVGGRAIPGQYPRASSSALYRNDGGRFTLDSTHVGILNGVGLVSAASFADMDGDADADLILAREWDSVLLLLNQNGRFTSTSPLGESLQRWTSRWNGVATGDVNGDGRLDIVATSWGRNTVAPADSTRPLVLLHGPIGASGQEEPLLARVDPRLSRDALAPLNSFGRVRSVIRGVSTRIRTFGAYADATVSDVLGAETSRTERKTAVSLDHMLFLNRGTHFDASPLPTEAQFAPAFYAAVADFDGDGFEDVFLAQNFSATALGLPRYDVGRGLLLAGNGRGGFRSVPGTESGIRIYGDQRGAAYADVDADARLDLVVSQNAGETILLRNRGARPGLRVRLIGPPSNPDAIGAQVRVVYADGAGPMREIQAGSGYWSQNGAVQVFGLSAAPTAVAVRWPGETGGGGREQRVPVTASSREIVVRHGQR